MADPKIQNAEELIKSVGIPPQPTVIMSIRNEVNKPHPNMSLIADLVSKDIGLSASVVKIASSPFIGMGKISSIDRALNLMGMTNFFNLVLASALQGTLTIKGVPKKIFDAFWNHSLQIAKTSQLVMKKADSALQSEAYMAGLFHDCAIPLLIKKFAEYHTIVDFAIGPTPVAGKIEESLYKTNHSVVGHLLAKSWHLSTPVCEAILWHHSLDEIKDMSDKTARKINACIQFSEKIVLEETVKSYKENMPDDEFDTMTSIQYTAKSSLNKLMEELEIDKNDVLDVREDIHKILGAER
ncbi:MAG: HDOD domain-containing protein [Nitrospirae bacterium]|uniref:Signal transduction protein n=1 Tax=uncultured Nitrospirota bacterium TaxID=170969 RepID=A0A142BTS9_9BACT|nr:signal transduction protein [uncultured Nitrospirota bacterium]MBF0328625.1 HDOD domain-containing protein [Nitrospirota bacterium]